LRTLIATTALVTLALELAIVTLKRRMANPVAQLFIKPFG
jgi:hypothetical protein